jgi:phosphoribosylanthranilate isomerase
MMKAKICGITHLEDALYAAHHGAWAIGFNFYQPSPRYVSWYTAYIISQQLPSSVITVGILIDCSPETMRHVLTFLNFIQVYRSEPWLDKKRTILALNAPSEDTLPNHSVLQAYAYVLLDAPKCQDGLLGGTGRLANWDMAKTLAKRYPLILAGGLNSTNVTDAIQQVKPFAVDVASGVETSPGIKSASAVQAFLKHCQYAS